jgi:hypothetical protein
MKSSTAKQRQSADLGNFALTREQAEKFAAVEGMALTDRMKRILDLSVSGDKRRALIEALIRRG